MIYKYNNDACIEGWKIVVYRLIAYVGEWRVSLAVLRNADNTNIIHMVICIAYI